MIDVEPLIEQSFGRLWPVPVVEPDWNGVLRQAGVQPRRVRRRRALAVGALAAAVIAVLAATPIGAAIARSIWNFPAWLDGHPGTPASSQAQKDFERANARSWTAFPRGAQLRKLIATSRAGSDYTLYGFRSGDELCLRLVVTGVARGSTTGCAPLSDLRSRPAPAIPIEVDDIGFGNVPGKHVRIDGRRYTIAQAGVTFGIVADGVRAVIVRSSDATRRAFVANDAFLVTVSEPKAGARADEIIARTSDGHSYSVPFAQTPFATALRVSAPHGTVHGPAKVQRVVHGGNIAWLTRHEPRGEPLPRRFPSALNGTRSRLLYGRLIQPDPRSPLRVSVSLYRVRSAPSYTHLKPGLYVCDFLVEGRGAGGGCNHLATAFQDQQFSFSLGGSLGSDQYELLGGIASDQVARLRIFFGDDGTLSVPVKDNAFATLVSRARFPIRVVAYDSASRVIGIDTEGGDEMAIPPAPVKGAAWTTVSRAVAADGTSATISTEPAHGGGLCWRIRFSDEPGSNAICPSRTWEGPPVNLVVQDTTKGGALIYGRVSPQVSTVVVRYRNGTNATVKPYRGLVLVGAPQHVTPPANPVAEIIGLDKSGKQLGVEDYRHTPALRPPPPRSR